MRTVFAVTCFILVASAHEGRAQKMTEAEQKRLNDFVAAGHDPYFVESRDTVSAHGPNCITRDLLQDRKGDYWLATWKGIIKWDGKIFTNYTLKEGLIPFHVYSCYEDKKGNLWFGTARGGVYRYDGRNFELYTTKDGLPDNSITDFAEDGKGNLWLATDKGLSRFDGRTATNFTVKDGLPTDKVSALLIDKDGNLLVGCAATTIGAGDGGLMVYTPAATGPSFQRFGGEQGKQIKEVLSLHQDKGGKIWIGSFGGLVTYQRGQLSTHLDTLLTYYFAEDGKGNVWFTQSSPPLSSRPSTPRQILYRYAGSAFTKVLEKSEPSDFQIFGKIVDSKGDLWFGTMRGICKWDGKWVTYF